MHTIRPGHELPGRVLITSREQASGLYPLGLSQNPPKQTGAGPSEHLVAQIKLTLSERQRTRAHFYTLLLEYIRAPCRTAVRIADASPLQGYLRRSAPYKGHAPCAALRLSPLTLSIAFSLLVMRNMGPHHQACSTGRGAASPGLGGTPTSERRYPKRISPLIACPQISRLKHPSM